MSAVATPPMPTTPQVSLPLVMLLAVGAGLSAASLYYNQPILSAVAIDLGATTTQVGLVPMLTQLGYAGGVLLLAPLGDRFERRRVILTKLPLLAAALVLAALAPNVHVLAVSSLLIGVLATAAQDFVPAAAAIAAPSRRGKTVGTVMTGLLLGILLSRVVSGALAERAGWRAPFAAAALSITVLAALAAWRLPRFAPTTQEGYLSLLRSMASLLAGSRPLRRAVAVQALLSVAFSGFWSTLALALAAEPYRLGSTVAGAFGIAGAVGAMAAPLAGSLADRRGPISMARVGALVTALAFAAMAIWQGSLWVLVAATVVFDLGVQSTLIAHQTVIYGLEPSARSRLNALLISGMFVGMSLGAVIANHAFAHFGWLGVTCSSAAFAVAALLLRSAK